MGSRFREFRPLSEGVMWMSKRCLLNSVSAAREDYVTEIADTPDRLAEAFRLRHQVYCIERGYETSQNGMETDGFDGNARHVVLRRRADREVVGTVRVVLPSRRPGFGLPLQQVCDPSVMAQLPLATMGEISRFALSKERRAGTGEAGVFMRLGLMQGILQVSQEAGLTHWCAIMERSLLRLLQATAIHFQPMGPLVEFHGIRQPAIGRIDTILDRIWREATPVFDYVTADGALWSSPVPMRLAA